MEPPKECYAACCPDSLSLFPGDRQDRESRQRDLLPAEKALPADEPAQQQVLFENIARAMGDALRMIRIRHIGNCYRADPAYGEGVARALGIPMSEVLV